MSETAKLLKVRFDKVTLKEATEKCMNWAKQEGSKHYVTTPNPEILLEAQVNTKFLRVLNKSDLNIADGIGILWGTKYKNLVKDSIFKTGKVWKFVTSLLCVPFAPKKLRSVLPERVTGVDLMQEVCKKSVNHGLKIFLLGAESGVAAKTQSVLEKKYPGIYIAGTFSGSPKKDDEKESHKLINDVKPDILFVAFGAPNQEIWIAENMRYLKTTKLAVGIGGAFDFIAGKKKRAPKIVGKLGLEWLYRLIQQPSRIKRIYNAIIKFPIKVAKKY